MNQKRNIKFLEKKEIEQIINAIPAEGLKNRRDRALISLLFSTGLRISEALALKRNDLAKDPSQTLELSIIGKMGYQRTVYVSPEALRVILRYFAGRRDNDERVFPIGIRAVQLMVKRRAKEAGMEKWITPHKFRHSLATDLLRQGVDIRYVQEFLGHKSLNNTMVYTHCVNDDLRKIHEKIYK